MPVCTASKVLLLLVAPSIRVATSFCMDCQCDLGTTQGPMLPLSEAAGHCQPHRLVRLRARWVRYSNNPEPAPCKSDDLRVSHLDGVGALMNVCDHSLEAVRLRFLPFRRNC